MAGRLVLGVERDFCADIKELLEWTKTKSTRGDFVIVPLFRPNPSPPVVPKEGKDKDKDKEDDLYGNTGVIGSRLGCGMASEVTIDSNTWINNVVGKASEDLSEGLDSTDIITRKTSEISFRDELQWTAHLGLQAVLLPTPSLNAPNYARCLHYLINTIITYQQMWIRIPYVGKLPKYLFPEGCADSDESDKSSESSSSDLTADPWEVWDNFRSFGNYDVRVCIALELTKESGQFGGGLSGGERFLEQYQRWRAEPVKCIIIPIELFIMNDAGFPVLCKEHQDVLMIILPTCSNVVIRGGGVIGKDVDLTQHYAYLTYIHKQSKGDEDQFIDSYKDHLQTPLQPLKDNLESTTYEVFEKDPIKYQQYEKAIFLALSDLLGKSTGLYDDNYDDEGEDEGEVVVVDEINLQEGRGHSKATNKKRGVDFESGHGGEHIESKTKNKAKKRSKVNPSTVFKVTVVGAGRGPLVKCALKAAQSLDINIKIIAVEKNPNAVITLRHRCAVENWENVRVISTDMRCWDPSEDDLADILVSELLGSWGDNELSPECLDGAEKCLKVGGVSIPQDYTSFMAPLSTCKLWAKAREKNDMAIATSGMGISTGATLCRPPPGLETPYVVKIHDAKQLARESPVFHFEHPNGLPIHEIDNTRYACLSFTADCTAALHGFAGSFESTLYKDVMISIRPTTHSPGMFSWFPLFLPLLNPVRVNTGDVITVSIWRCTDERRVWYEWCLISPLTTPIQNPNGRSYAIGL